MTDEPLGESACESKEDLTRFENSVHAPTKQEGKESREEETTTPPGKQSAATPKKGKNKKQQGERKEDSRCVQLMYALQHAFDIKRLGLLLLFILKVCKH